jgi:ATP/ADP translocase
MVLNQTKVGIISSTAVGEVEDLRIYSLVTRKHFSSQVVVVLICEFEASLVYIYRVSSRTATATQRNPVKKTKNKKQKNKKTKKQKKQHIPFFKYFFKMCLCA